MSRKAEKEPTRYLILQTVFSVQHGHELQPGEVVEFDLSEQAEYKPNIERLVSRGALEVYTGVWPVPVPEPTPENPMEVSNG